MIYLDHAATTPLRPEARAAMEPFLTGEFGNPSGSHAVSRRAKDALEEARERAALLLGCQPLEIVFTGGGTEADNLAVKGAALAGGEWGGVVVSALEHEAVLEPARLLERWGCPLAVAPVDRNGRVDPEQVAAAAAGVGTAVVSVMLANNETGVIQPVAEVVRAVHAAAPGVAVHTDAVQAFPSEEVRVDRLGVDLLTLAAHKVGGPKGVGLLYVRDGVRLEPVLHGGGQELGRRSGTHDVMGVVGMVAAMEAAVDDRARFRRDVTAARLGLETGLAGLTERTVSADLTLVQHSHLLFPAMKADTLLVLLDRMGVAASAGSACSSGAATVSHVLTAMGVEPDRARRSLRFSLGWTTRPEDGFEAAGLVRGLLEAA